MEDLTPFGGDPVRRDPIRRAAHSAQLARYDPPWTLPMWRRNEIVVEPYTPLTMHPSP